MSNIYFINNDHIISYLVGCSVHRKSVYLLFPLKIILYHNLNFEYFFSLFFNSFYSCERYFSTLILLENIVFLIERNPFNFIATLLLFFAFLREYFHIHFKFKCRVALVTLNMFTIQIIIIILSSIISNK